MANLPVNVILKADASGLVSEVRTSREDITKFGKTANAAGKTAAEGMDKAQKATMTWHQFIKGRMGPLMKKFAAEGKSHAEAHTLAIRQIAREWKEYKKTGVAANRAVQQSSRNSVNGMRRLGSSIKSINRAMFSLKGLLVSAGIGLSAREVVRTADAYKLASSQLRLVTTNQAQLNTALDETFKIAQETRSSYTATITLYARMARSTKQLYVSQQDLLTVTKAVNQSFRISGASAQEANAAVIQFAQGLASNTLRGDELRSVLEQAPRLGEAIVAGLEGVDTKGKSAVGVLRELAEAGELTTERIIKALLNQSKTLDSEYAKIETTVGQAWTTVENAAMRYIGIADQASGTTSELSASLSYVADNFDDLADSVLIVGGVIVTVMAGRVVSAITAATSETIALVASNQRQRVAALAAAQAEFVHADAIRINTQMKLANAQADFARLTGMARLTAVQTRLIPAQRALTTATTATAAAQTGVAVAAGRASVALGVGRTALGLFGGPLGLVITLLSSATLAMFAFGDSEGDAAESTRELDDRVKQLTGSYKDLQREQIEKTIQDVTEKMRQQGEVIKKILSLNSKTGQPLGLFERGDISDATQLIGKGMTQVEALRKQLKKLDETATKTTGTLKGLGAASNKQLGDRLKGLTDSLRTEREKVIAWYKESVSIVDAAESAKIELASGYADIRSRLEQELQDKLNNIQRKGNDVTKELLLDTVRSMRRNIRGVISGALRGDIKNVKDVLGVIKNLFINFIADLGSRIATVKLAKMFGWDFGSGGGGRILGNVAASAGVSKVGSMLGSTALGAKVAGMLGIKTAAASSAGAGVLTTAGPAGIATASAVPTAFGTTASSGTIVGSAGMSGAPSVATPLGGAGPGGAGFGASAAPIAGWAIVAATAVKLLPKFFNSMFKGGSGGRARKEFAGLSEQAGGLENLSAAATQLDNFKLIATETTLSATTGFIQLSGSVDEINNKILTLGETGTAWSMTSMEEMAATGEAWVRYVGSVDVAKIKLGETGEVGRAAFQSIATSIAFTQNDAEAFFNALAERGPSVLDETGNIGREAFNSIGDSIGLAEDFADELFGLISVDGVLSFQNLLGSGLAATSGLVGGLGDLVGAAQAANAAIGAVRLPSGDLSQLRITPRIPVYKDGGVASSPHVAIVGDAGSNNPEIIFPVPGGRFPLDIKGGVGTGGDSKEVVEQLQLLRKETRNQAQRNIELEERIDTLVTEQKDLLGVMRRTESMTAPAGPDA
ncbi:MAG TPA: hypothetical protein ENI80_03580 [Acidiferrobacteraceae bacterium]|nr:hypothetical protein [Acidiferrobacteraceae bacterium]